MKVKLIISLMVTTSFLTACAHHQQEINPTNLQSLENVQEQEPRHSSNDMELSGIRVKALEDTALSLAAQGGLAATSDELNTRVEKDKRYLDTLFNFNGMMLSHGVLPPVLVQGDNSLNLADPNTIRVADKTYKIVQQARFVTTPPNWRDYIWMTYPKPEIPNKFLMPKNAEERKIWVRSVRSGWDKGVQQAYNIFQQNLARLKRDYQGMILYRKLLQEHMINAPYVSRTELGVTGDGSDMRINDQVLRITEMPKLQTESQRWKAIVVKEDEQ
jgi:defect-in-organelle-trafficking protein DotC